MNDIDEMTGGAAGPATTTQRGSGLSDDFAGAAATIPARRVANGHRPRAGEAQQVTGEEKGDEFAGPMGGETTFGSADYQDAGSTPAGEAFAVASVEQLARAEAGEESAADDLQDFGYAPIAQGESDTAPMAQDAGAVDNSQSTSAEFLPILGALVPTLVSTIGPAIAKGVLSRLSPRTRQTVARIAKTAVAVAPGLAAPISAATPGAATAAPGGIDALLAMLSKLLTAAAAKPGGESGMEASDPLVEECARVLELVIGKDDRVQIQGTTATPWRYLCALSGVFPDGARYTGTGFFIGARTLATAGHCVYSQGHGGWAKSLTVIPAANGSENPYGQAQAESFRSTAGWVNNRSAQTDIGCVVLPRGAFSGRNLGHFGFGVWQTAELLALPAVLAGYPGDKTFAQLWGTSRVIQSASPTTLVYPMDTYGGQSGAPVYIKRNGQRYVVGIHNYGAQTGNSATRVTQPVYALLAKWAAL
jgi:glutamyl endopeptidase